MDSSRLCFGQIGEAPDEGRSIPPPSYTDEDQQIVEERLRSLGYL